MVGKFWGKSKAEGTEENLTQRRKGGPRMDTKERKTNRRWTQIYADWRRALEYCEA
jgi:hypothetical protein